MRTNNQTIPIWLEALVASGCQAVSDREARPIDWRWVEERAYYRNSGTVPERIDLLDVTLVPGKTLQVTWAPEQTAYTLEVTD
jgi:hypothetical protein